MSSNYLHFACFSLLAEFAQHPKHLFRCCDLFDLSVHPLEHEIFHRHVATKEIHHLRLQSSLPPTPLIPTQLVTWQHKKYIIFVCNQQRTSLPPPPPPLTSQHNSSRGNTRNTSSSFAINNERHYPRTESPETPGKNKHSKNSVPKPRRKQHSTSKKHKNNAFRSTVFHTPGTNYIIQITLT